MKKLSTLLKNPPADSRPWVIWTWNSCVEKKQLLEQIDSMVQAGIGGISIRTGMKMQPAFLSEDFNELFEIVLKRAHEHHVSIRYHEDFSLPWNHVFSEEVRKNKAFRAQQIRLVHSEILEEGATFTRDVPNPSDMFIITGQAHEDFFSLKNVTSHKLSDKKPFSWSAPQGRWYVLVLQKEYAVDPYLGYQPNILNSTFPKLYCENVCEEFRKRFSKYMPDTFEGFVVEMPSLFPGDNALRWDDDVAIKFRSKLKKDLLRYLPTLFLPIDDNVVKHKIHTQAYFMKFLYKRVTEPVETWMKNHRMSLWTLHPDTLPVRSTNELQNCIPLPSETPGGYVGMQNIQGTENGFPAFKSMIGINTFEAKRESIAVIGRSNEGQTLTLQDLKNEADIVLPEGIKKILIDGFLYYPERMNYPKNSGNMFSFSPEWKHFASFCDYIGRIQCLFENTTFSPEVAVVMPSVSMLGFYRPDSDNAVTEGMKQLVRCMEELQRLGFAYDVISEDFLRTCSVRQKGDFGILGKQRKGNYQAVIFPYSPIVTKSVIVFLEKLMSKQGLAVFLNEYPRANTEDGHSDHFTQRFEKIQHSKNGNCTHIPLQKLESTLKNIHLSARVHVHGKKSPDVSLIRASIPSGSLFFVRNRSEKTEYPVTLEVDGTPSLFQIDCTRGEWIPVEPGKNETGQSSVNFTLCPSQSIILHAPEPGTSSPSHASQKKCTGEEEKKSSENTEASTRNYRIVLKKQWSFTPLSLNTLPLAGWSEKIGLNTENGGFSHFYETYFETEEPPDCCVFVLNGNLPLQNCLLQSVQNVEVMINANQVFPGTSREMFRPKTEENPEEQKVDFLQLVENTPILKSRDLFYNITPFVTSGYNRVSIRSNSSMFHPFSITYPPLILGNFSISYGSKGWVIDEDPILSTEYGSWTKSGYPYLSGWGMYQQSFEIPARFNRLILRASQVSGCVAFTLNGKNAGEYLWQPIEVDITSLCESKRNEISIVVCNTLDNTLRLKRRTSGLLGEVYIDVY